MKRATFSPVADADLDEIVRYIAHEDPPAAGRVSRSVLDTAELLAKFPALGTRPRFRSARFKGVRFLPARGYRNYLLFYLEKEHEVEILRILHAARDWTREFRDE